MNTKAITYLILLMDSLGLKINPQSVKSFWGRIGEPDALDENILESLIYLWEASKRSGETPPDLRKNNSGECGPGPIGQEKASSGLNKESSNFIVTQQSEALDEARDMPGQADIGSQNSSVLAGRYLYGLVGGAPVSFEAKGIEQSPVRLVWFKDLGAITHACAPVPYQSNNEEQVTDWLKQHQQVLDLAAEKFHTIIPIGFDMILDGSPTKDPDEIVVNWLEQNYESMVELIQKLAGKAEYGIRISCPSERLIEIAKGQNPSIQRLAKKMAGMKPGTAYLYRSELESLIRSTVVEVRGMMNRELMEQLKNIVKELKEGTIVKKYDASGAEMIANLAVLMEPEKADDMGAILEDYQNRFQVTVHYTGPWPPYSFANNDRLT